MNMQFKSTKELLGAYISSSWGGMRDIYKVIAVTPKTITLTKIKWTGDPDGDHSDPTWKPCKIKFLDGLSKPEVEMKEDWYEPGKMRLVRNDIKKVVKFDDDGFILMPHIGWSNQDVVSVIAMNDEEAKSFRFNQWWN